MAAPFRQSEVTRKQARASRLAVLTFLLTMEFLAQSIIDMSLTDPNMSLTGQTGLFVALEENEKEPGIRIGIYSREELDKLIPKQEIEANARNWDH